MNSLYFVPDKTSPAPTEMRLGDKGVLPSAAAVVTDLRDFENLGGL